jgi:hypothetical protein
MQRIHEQLHGTSQCMPETTEPCQHSLLLNAADISTADFDTAALNQSLQLPWLMSWLPSSAG